MHVHETNTVQKLNLHGIKPSFVNFKNPNLNQRNWIKFQRNMIPQSVLQFKNPDVHCAPHPPPPPPPKKKKKNCLRTDELNSIVLLLVDRLVDDDGVDAALLVTLCMGLHEGIFACIWSVGSLDIVGEWIGSKDVRTGLVSPLAWISFSIAVDKTFKLITVCS